MKPTRQPSGHPRSLVALLCCLATGCTASVRVPLAVPLSPVGGSRPAGPQGIHVGLGFGDGVWGQEQERAELFGAEVGFSVRDRVEATSFRYASTRTVNDSLGDQHAGEPTSGLRGKVRLRDFHAGRASVAVHAGLMEGTRTRPDVQDEHLWALDLAVPVEFYPDGGILPDYGVGIFAAPRVVIQSFRDRNAGATTSGVALGAVVGLVGRWRHFAFNGELNVLKTPHMTFRNETLGGGVHLLPMLGVRGIVPVGS